MNPPAPVTHTRFTRSHLPVRVPCFGVPGRPPGAKGATALHHREHGLPDDQSVERERPLLDVAQVETDRLIPVQVGAAVDLPEAGQAGLHEQPPPCLALVAPVGDRQRTGADERHLTAQHVDQLRELVERRAAQPPPDPRDPRIGGDLEQFPGPVPVQRVETGPQRLGAADHRAELPHPELAPVPPGPGLAEDRRPGAGEPDGQPDSDQQRQEGDQCDECRKPVEERLRHAPPAGQLRLVDVQQRQPADRPDRDPGARDVDQRRGHQQVDPRPGEAPGQHPQGGPVHLRTRQDGDGVGGGHPEREVDVLEAAQYRHAQRGQVGGVPPPGTHAPTIRIPWWGSWRICRTSSAPVRAWPTRRTSLM